MFNRKRYAITLIVMGVLAMAVIITNSIYAYIDWLWVILVSSGAYIYLKYRVSGPLQMFATRFTMLVDYDLNIDEAEKLAYDGMMNAPTKNVEALYQVYYGMALYYGGKYEAAIKCFNSIELKRLNALYHVLIFAFTCYSAFELGDLDTFNFTLERIHNVKAKVPPKYTNFVSSYEEILDSIKNIDVALDNYKEVIERHFSRNDGYITTQLVYQYRLALYFEKLGDDLERDKCLAFVIANGKNHHTAISARMKFKGLVNVDDFIIKEPVEPVNPLKDEIIEIETAEPTEIIETETDEDSENGKKEE